MANYRLRQTGQEVQDLLDKIEQAKIEDGTITIGEESLTPVSSEELQQGLAGKQDVISDLSAIREGATLGATAYQKPADGIAKEDLVASVQASLEKADTAIQSETDPTVPAWAKQPAKPSYALAELQEDATHRTVTDTEKATWDGKQDAIADLDAIRSGAGAGATAVQPSQMQTALAGKQDTLVSGTNIKTINNESLLGGGDIHLQAEIYISDTWAAIKALRDAGELVNGAYYRITDYVATTVTADTRSANHPFDIIVCATSNNSLSEEAFAIQHEGDTYFSGSKLNAWELRYCIDNDQTRFAWADTENGKGVVYRLKDEHENDIPYDFKGIQFKRYYVESVNENYAEALTALIGLPIALAGTGSTGLVAGSEFKWYYTFSVLGDTWAEEVTDASLVAKARTTAIRLPEKTSPRLLNNNVFANGPVLIQFLKSFDGTTMCEIGFASVNAVYDGEAIINNSVFGNNANVFTMSQYRGNTIVGMHRHMDYATDAQFNTIFLYYDFAHCHMGHYFHRNVLAGRSEGSNFYDINFQENYIYTVKSCQDTVFGQRFMKNTIVLSSQFVCCSFGADCTNNTFTGSSIQISDFSNCVRYCSGEGFYTNGCRFGEQINYCTFNGRFRGCSFGNYMYYVQFNGGTSPNTFHGVDVSGTILGTSAESLLVIDSPYFLSDHATEVQRRITLQGDADGNLVATWMDDGALTGIQKAPSDADWSPLPGISVNAVEYVEQTLTDAQKTQARTNIGAGTYSKPATGIPETDLAQAVVDKLNAEEIFIATYGTTTQAQVQAAASAGKVIVCFYGNKMYVYAGESAAGYSQFTSVLYDKAYRIYLRNSSWGSASYDLPIDAVLYTTQNLSDSQKSVARGNIGAGTYSKPDGGIPASDMAEGVIPDVSQFVTATVNNLVNYYLKSETYTRDEIQALIAAIPGMLFVPVNTLPTASAETVNKIYIVPATNPQTQNQMDEFYTKVDGSSYTWEYFGSASIDLSNYVTTTALNAALADYTTTANLTTLLAGKQDTINDLATIRSGAAAGATAYQKPSGGIPKDDLASAVQSSLGKADTALQSFTETDPTVPAWAKASTKPSYTASEVGALPDTTQLSDLSDDATHRLVTDTEKANWNAKYSKPSGGIPAADLADKYAGSPSAGGPANKTLGIPFGNVDAGSTATVLTATVDNFPTTLTDGVCAYIRNNVIASEANFTLNINGTGAKPVYASNADATRVSTIFSAATTYLFIYNANRVAGGCWDIYYGYNSNDNTIGYNLRTNKMTLPTTSACYRYRLLFTSADGTHFVPANASSSTNATATRTTTQTPIDPFGSIRYYGYTSAVSSGSRPGVSYLWEQYSVTLGYSFNRTGAALELTEWKPVYIKCAPQENGSAIIDAETPYVQELPTTNDGKIYIHLGVATSETAVEMTLYHPVYYYKDGAIRVWTNAAASGTSDEALTTSEIQTIWDSVMS